MTNSPNQIGTYAIERELGRGGMGVVYLAKDPRLDRHVAIKVLPDIVARDPERLARFEREARLLATLNHPNIGGIHGLEEADGQRFLVLEYLQGETLASRLKSGALRSSDAIHICAQIAAALEAAHESGIIHRDLKPGNVMLNDDDEVKVLDFGLAKGGEGMAESSSDLSASPTLTVGATAVGVVLGTAAYMSPEQARGKPVDRRTDIWSFGAVLYECLTGKQLFGGETVSDTIAKILERQPDWDTLPSETPDRVKELIRRCLEKKAKERLRDIGDARIELEEVESGKASSISGVTAGVPLDEHRSKVRRGWIAAAVAAVVAIVMAGIVISRPSVPEQPLTRLQVTMPGHLDLGFAQRDVKMSPDGRMIAFVATDTAGAQLIYTRKLGSLDVVPVPGTEDGFSPFWSPDSRNIGFFANAKLKIVSLDDGQSESLADVSSDRGGSWGDGIILFAGAQGPIFKVPVNGGTVEAATVVDTAAGETAHRFPEFLPDHKRFMYAVLPARTARTSAKVADLGGSQPIEIMSALGRPVYVETGHLIWQRGRRLIAQRFDEKSLELRGEPEPIGEAPPRAAAIGTPPISVSRAGTILHFSPNWPSTRLEWQDYRGHTLGHLRLDNGKLYNEPSIAPDGKQMIIGIAESPEESSLWLVELERMALTRLTSGLGTNRGARWSSKGDRILYASDRDGPSKMYIRALDRPNEDELVIESGAMFVNPFGWSADDRYVLYSRPGAGTAMDLWIARVDGDEPESRPFLATPYNEDNATISPDGRWVTYDSDESGRSEVYVTSFPEAGRSYRVTTNGGFAGGWSYDGKRLFFFRADGWLGDVQVQPGESFRASAPRRLFRPPDNNMGGDTSPVEPRFLTVLDTSPPVDRTLTVVSGWQSELEK